MGQSPQQQQQFTGMNSISVGAGDKYAVLRNTDPNAPSVFSQGGQLSNSNFVSPQPTGQFQPQQQQFGNNLAGGGFNGGFPPNINQGFVQNQPTGYRQW